MRTFVAIVLLSMSFFFPVAGAQEIQNFSVNLNLWLYPDQLNGRRGREIDLKVTGGTGGAVQGTITMHGLGADFCRLSNNAVHGTYTNDVLSVSVRIEAGDNISCPMSIELTQKSGKWSGEYTNAAFKGKILPQ